MPKLIVPTRSYGLMREMKTKNTINDGLELQFPEAENILVWARKMVREMAYDICEMPFTTYLAAIFMGLALLISLIASPGSNSGSSIIEDAQQDGSLAPNSESLSLPTVPLQEDIDKD